MGHGKARCKPSFSNKKESLIMFIKKIMVNIPREDTLRPCTRFQPHLEEVMAAKANFL